MLQAAFPTFGKVTCHILYHQVSLNGLPSVTAGKECQTECNIQINVRNIIRTYKPTHTHASEGTCLSRTRPKRWTTDDDSHRTWKWGKSFFLQLAVRVLGNERVNGRCSHSGVAPTKNGVNSPGPGSILLLAFVISCFYATPLMWIAFGGEMWKYHALSSQSLALFGWKRGINCDSIHS